MEIQRAVHSPPQVGVLDGDHLAMMFPSPVVGAPFFQAAVEDAVDVAACGHDGDVRRLRYGLQSADESQELEALAMRVRFIILDLHRVRAVVGFEHEAPPAGSIEPVGARAQKKVGCGDAHVGPFRKVTAIRARLAYRATEAAAANRCVIQAEHSAASGAPPNG